MDRVQLDATKLGDFQVTFGLAQEGVTWFADPTLGGGPEDGLLRVHLVVVPPGASLDAGAAGDPDADPDASRGNDSAARADVLALVALALVRRRRSGAPSSSR